MLMFSVKKQKCIKCGACVQVCPASVVSFGANSFPATTEASEKNCIRCGHCVLHCPTGAAEMEFIEAKKLVKADSISMPEAEQGLNLLKTRRSVRLFKPDDIGGERLAKIIEAASKAPSATNAQRVRWIVVDGADRVRQLSNCVISEFSGSLEENPSDPRAPLIKRICERAANGYDVILRGGSCVVLAVVPKSFAWPEDGVIALTYVELAAHALGVGACWAGFLTFALRGYPALRGRLGIKDDEYICGAQILGLPSVKPFWQFAPRREYSVDYITDL